MASKKIVHVAVGVILNQANEILLAKRPAHVHQGGLWEFPGGKVDSGETVVGALIRELQEELAITVLESEPLLDVYHDYADKSVRLEVCLVRRFSGEACGNEGQPIAWVSPQELSNYDFPAANVEIVTAIRKLFLSRMG